MKPTFYHLIDIIGTCPFNSSMGFILSTLWRKPGGPQMLKLSEVHKLLDNEYLPVEAGFGLTKDNMYHVAASTYMYACTAEMIDWWFGDVHHTEQYKLWHPRDHVFSDWEGPRENKSEYGGGHHLVHEYIGGDLNKLKISFKSPAEYFGEDWRQRFTECGYGTAICGRTGLWDEESGHTQYVGHLIHLIKTEPDGCRMLSRFWLGHVDGLPMNVGFAISEKQARGLLKHSTEEMAILASQLPALYQEHSTVGS